MAQYKPPVPIIEEQPKQIEMNISLDSIITNLEAKTQSQTNQSKASVNPQKQSSEKQANPKKSPQKQENKPTPEKPIKRNLYIKTRSRQPIARQKMHNIIENQEFTPSQYTSNDVKMFKPQESVEQQSLQETKYDPNNVKMTQRNQESVVNTKSLQETKYDPNNVKMTQRNQESVQTNTKFSSATYNTKADVALKSSQTYSQSQSFKAAMYKFAQIKDRLKQQFTQNGGQMFKGDLKNYKMNLNDRSGQTFADGGQIKGGQVDYSNEIAQMKAEIAKEKGDRERRAIAQRKAIIDAVLGRQAQFRASNRVQQPQRASPVSSNPPPIYPMEAEILGITGTTVFEVSVLADASVSSVRIIKSSGNQILDDEAKYTVTKSWAFNPATDQFGNPKNDTITVNISFDF